VSRADRGAPGADAETRSGPRRPGSRQRSGVQFDARERFDLAIAWVALSVAFTLFLGRPGPLVRRPTWALELLAICAASVGVGFILHELAHKVVAVRFGQDAAFRADYRMLGIAVFAALGGLLFAAPGAVHHRGRITDRENGLIALAGPATNLGLVVAFAPLLALPGSLGLVGSFGVLINAFLAAFNTIPFGPLDGRTVYRWHPGVFAVAFASSVLLTVGLYLTVGLPRLV